MEREKIEGAVLIHKWPWKTFQFCQERTDLPWQGGRGDWQLWQAWGLSNQTVLLATSKATLLSVCVAGWCCHLPLSSVSLHPSPLARHPTGTPEQPGGAEPSSSPLVLHLSSRELPACREIPVCLVGGEFIHFYFHPDSFSFVPTTVFQIRAKLVPHYFHCRVAQGMSWVHWHQSRRTQRSGRDFSHSDVFPPTMVHSLVPAHQPKHKSGISTGLPGTRDWETRSLRSFKLYSNSVQK